MRFSASTIGNAIAWLGVCALIATAIAIVHRLGAAGLILLGVATAFVCTMAELNNDTPSGSPHILRARMDRPALETSHERETLVSILRFYKRCGFFLVVVG